MKIFARYGLTLPISESFGKVGDVPNYPHFAPADFVRTLERLDRLDLLFAGRRNISDFQATLSEFWVRSV